MEPETLVDRLMDVLERAIIPLTEQGVRAGNKIFGAAILDNRDGSVVVSATNRESLNPLWHGEVACLNDYWALPPERRPPPDECVFFSTHEPCSMCLSAITWSGFRCFYYFFSYEDSRDAFAIPHDLEILKEVFRCEDGSYAAKNAYWESDSIGSLIDAGSVSLRDVRLARADAIRGQYAALSLAYQAGKGRGDIPLP